jgi:hypothetical protein
VVHLSKITKKTAMRFASKLLWVFPLIICSFTASTQCLLRPVELNERIDNSSAIIEGRVIGKNSYWNSQHNLIYTAYTVEVYKIFKGDPSQTIVEIITEGGIVGAVLHRFEPNLEMLAGDVGIFMLEPAAYEKSGTSTIPVSATFRAYALLQGFVKYNEATKSATDVFNKYDNIPALLYNRIVQRTGNDYRIVKPYSIDQNNQRSNNILVPPAISSISPTTISAGTQSQLTINGNNFGAAQGTSTVLFKNADNGGATDYTVPNTEIVSWSNTQIVLNVPTRAGTGQVKVDVPGEGTATSAETLVITFSNLNVSSGGEWPTRMVNDNSMGGYTWSYFTGFNDNATARDAFERAFINWRCGTLVNWQVGSTTSTNVQAADGINVVRFDIGAELSAGVLGQCGSYWAGCAGNNWFLQEMDIRFDDGTDWYYGLGSPGFTQFDFESVALHELGHGHQLGHVIDPGAVMHYAIANGAQNRVLSANDIAGGNAVMTRSTGSSICGQTVMTALTMGTCTFSSTGDYRSKQTGNWADASSWERFDGTNWVNAGSAPANTDGVISIRNGHTVTVAAAATADQVVVNGGGTLTITSTFTLNDGTGTDLSVNGTVNFNSGTFAGAGTTEITTPGIFNFATAGAKTISTGITNNGTINWQDGAITQGANVTVANNATFNINSAATWDATAFLGILNNNGTISKLSAGTTTLAFSQINNSGTVNLNAGTVINQSAFTNTANLTFNGGVFSTSTNPFNHNTGSVISGTGTFNNNNFLNLNIDWNVPSTLILTTAGASQITGNGNLTVNNDFTLVNNISGNGSFTVNGNLTWTSGSLSRNFTNAPGRTMTISTTSPKTIGAVTVTNNGTLNWVDGNVTLSNGTLLSNTSTFNISGNNTLSNAAGNATLTNTGTISKSSTGTTTNNAATFNNNAAATIKGVGTIVIGSATFNSNGIIAPGLSPGIITINTAQPFSANSTLSIEIAGNGGAGQPTGHDQLQRAGNITLNGTLTVTETGAVPDGSYTILSLTSGTVSGTFSTLNLPPQYSVTYNSNNVVVTKSAPCTPSVVIAADPGNTICAGTNVTFTATPTNGGTPTYQWKLNGNNVGTNSNTYSNNALVNADQVSCEMTSSLACANPVTVTSNTITMTVNAVVTPSVSISANPGNTICAGTNVTFTATPTNGGVSPSYQWKLNGNDVGTNSDTYSNASLANGDVITCVMTSNATCASPATATSNAITMTVNPLVTPSVSIAASPGSTICAGTNVTFTATPTNGGASPSYQWKLNGSNVGTNSNTYSNAALANGDVVSCVMTSNASCLTTPTATSNDITMVVSATVVPSVSIAADPGNTICAGTNVTFTATPTNGGASPSYQWKLNGNNVGTNSNTYSNATLANGDVVTCEMVSSFACASPATATSNVITMTVNPLITPSVSIAANPGNTICAGTNVTFTATPTNGGASPSYQWKLNGNNVGTNSDTYSNASLANGDVITCVMTSNANCASPTTVTSNAITMTVNPLLTPSVSIAASPGNTICAGTNVTFTATPTNGGASPSYQWKLNGSNVGTNSNTYSNAALVNGDVVSCVMTSNASCLATPTATSNDITMIVTGTVVPSVSIAANPGNTICAGTNVTFTATPTNGGASPSYQWKLNGNNVGTNSNTYSNASLTNGDVVTCEMTSSFACANPASATSNAITMTVTANVTPSVSIAASPGNTICEGTNVTFTATPTNGGASPSYQWKLNGNNVGSNSDTYSNASLANGDVIICVMTSSVTCVTSATATSNAITMTVNAYLAPSVSIAASPGSTVCAGTNVTFTATPTNGSASPSYQWKLNGNNVGTNSPAYSNASLATGDVVSCVMTSSYPCLTAPTATSNTIAMTINTAPAINTHPAGQSVCPGTNVTFSVSATGTGLTYQWRKGGVNISGATAASYTISGVTAADAGNYDVVVSGTCTPAATSNTAVLTVLQSPAISTQPANQTVFVGQNVTFSVVATGSGLTYQWRKGGVNIAGATGSSYTISNVTTADAGNFDVVVSGTCSPPATSNIATLTVLTIVINTHPADRSVCVGANATFSISASGANLTYQWQVSVGGGAFANISGATSSTLTLNAVTLAMNGNRYRCMVSGSLTSNAATLTVNPLPVVTLNLPFDTLHMKNTQQTLSGGSPSGGTYSGTGISGTSFVPGALAYGNYVVTYRYTDANGCSSSAVDIFTVIPKASPVNLYPNPSTDGKVIIVVTPDMLGSRAVVFNTLGQKVADWTITGLLTVNRFKWPSGIYTVNIRRGPVQVTKTILIEK